MKTFYKKEYCRKCGKPFDPAKGVCPHCGCESVSFESVKGFRNMTPMGWGKELTLFLTGWLGFQLIGTLLSLIVLSTTKGAYESAGLSGASLKAALETFQGSAPYYAAVDFGVYVILFCLMLAILDRDLFRLTAKFKNPKTYYGFLGGVALLIFSAIYGYLISLSGLSTTNNNQSVVDELVRQNPLLSVLIFGLVGPFCEELTYRVGFFGFLKRFNVYVAYVVVALFFGFIHFDWQNASSAVEWAMLPDYVISGFGFALIYDKLGFGASWIAHCTNNLVGIIGAIIRLYSSK
jgi:membrane protease YdiL (CAAX protease family)